MPFLIRVRSIYLLAPQFSGFSDREGQFCSGEPLVDFKKSVELTQMPCSSHFLNMMFIIVG
jgi:hypothetical protein